MPWNFYESLDEFKQRMNCPCYRDSNGTYRFQNGAISIGGQDHQPPPEDDELLLQNRLHFARHFLSRVRREAAKLQAAGSGAVDDSSYPLPMSYSWNSDILGPQPMPHSHPHLFDPATGCDPLFDKILAEVVFPIIAEWRKRVGELQGEYESLPAVRARLDAERSSELERQHLESTRRGRMEAVRAISIP